MLVDGKHKLVPGNIEKLTPYVAGKTIIEVAESFHPERISKLASNENRLGCSPHVKEAVLKSLANIQDYPDPVARLLSRKIAGKLQVSQDQILLASGSESVITILSRTFLSGDDEVITADATFVKIFVEAAIQNIHLKKIPLTADFRFDLPRIAESVSECTKMIYIANPNNPTGTYVSRSEFESFMTAIPSDILVVMDEAYYEFAQHVSDYPQTLDYNYNNLIILRTFSKAYGLAGLRIGYAVSQSELIREMSKTKLVFEPSTPAQAAALAALDDVDFLNRTMEMVERNKKRLYDFFDDYGVSYVKSISNAVLMILGNENEAIDFTDGMLQKGVILRRVNGFGLPDCIRITVGTDDEMKHFEESFKEIYPLLNNKK